MCETSFSHRTSGTTFIWGTSWAYCALYSPSLCTIALTTLRQRRRPPRVRWYLYCLRNFYAAHPAWSWYVFALSHPSTNDVGLGLQIKGWPYPQNRILYPILMTSMPTSTLDHQSILSSVTLRLPNGSVSGLFAADSPRAMTSPLLTYLRLNAKDLSHRSFRNQVHLGSMTFLTGWTLERRSAAVSGRPILLCSAVDVSRPLAAGPVSRIGNRHGISLWMAYQSMKSS